MKGLVRKFIKHAVEVLATESESRNPPNHGAHKKLCGVHTLFTTVVEMIMNDLM